MALEWELAKQNRIGQNSHGPDISWRAEVLALTHDFGAHIGWRATEDFQGLITAATEAEVNQLYLAFRIYKDVLQLDVSVSYLHLV